MQANISPALQANMHQLIAKVEASPNLLQFLNLNVIFDQYW